MLIKLNIQRLKSIKYLLLSSFLTPGRRDVSPGIKKLGLKRTSSWRDH